MASGNSRFSACSPWGIIISVVFGAVVGVLFATENIPNIETAIWITFGLGVLSFILEFIDVDLAALNQEHSLYRCLYGEINCLLAGTIGTIVSSLALLSTTLETTSIPVDVLVAIDAFFFAEMVIGWIVLLNCLVNRRITRDC